MVSYIIFNILTVGFFYNTLSSSSRFRMRNFSSWESYYYAGANGIVLSAFGIIITVFLYYAFPFLFQFSQDDHLEACIPFELEEVNQAIFWMMWSLFSLVIASYLGNKSRKNGVNNPKVLEAMIVSYTFKHKVYQSVKNND